MAKRKRNHARRKSTSRSQPRDTSGVFPILLTGIVLGVVISFGVHLYRSGKLEHLGQGLGKLYHNIEEGRETKAPQAELKQEVTHIAPNYEYSHILLKNERPIPRFKQEPTPTKSKQEKQKTETARPGTTYVLQVAAFRDRKDAEEMKAKLAFTGLMAHIETVDLPGKGVYHRVRLGPYKDVAAMDKVDGVLSRNNINAARLAISK